MNALNKILVRRTFPKRGEATIEVVAFATSDSASCFHIKNVVCFDISRLCDKIKKELFESTMMTEEKFKRLTNFHF